MTHTARVQVREPVSNTRRRIARCFARYDFLRWCVRRSLWMLALVRRGGIPEPASGEPVWATRAGPAVYTSRGSRRAHVFAHALGCVRWCADWRCPPLVPPAAAASRCRPGDRFRGGRVYDTRRTDHVYFARARVGVYGDVRFWDESHRPPMVRARRRRRLGEGERHDGKPATRLYADFRRIDPRVTRSWRTPVASHQGPERKGRTCHA